MIRDELDRCMEAYMAAWPNTRLGASTFDLAEALLLPFAAQAVMASIAEFALSGREFAPPMGLIARRAVELVDEANGNRPPDAEEALREVYTAIARVGVYRTPEWSHPSIANVVEAMGGWEEVCAHENAEAFRAHFLKLYGTCADRVKRDALMAPVMRQLVGALNLSAERELPEGRAYAVEGRPANG